MTFAGCSPTGSSYPKTRKEKKKMAARVSLGFGRLSDTQFDNFAQSVINSLCTRLPQFILRVESFSR